MNTICTFVGGVADGERIEIRHTVHDYIAMRIPEPETPTPERPTSERLPQRQTTVYREERIVTREWKYNLGDFNDPAVQRRLFIAEGMTTTEALDRLLKYYKPHE